MAEQYDDAALEAADVVEIDILDEVSVAAVDDNIDAIVSSVDASFDDDGDDDVLVLEEVDASLTLPVWEPTGEPRVDAALDLLTMLDVDDVSGHAEVFAQVHDGLRAALTHLDG